jgi:hypothetical protein
VLEVKLDQGNTAFEQKRRRSDKMIALLNFGRLLMVVWVAYGLLLIFAPSIIHKAPDQTSGIIQVVVAYSLGYLLDRCLSIIRRRRASVLDDNQPTNDAGGT